MAECKKGGVDCPEFYECKTAGDMVAGSGKELDQYCFYCLGTPRIKKIGHKASWPGSTPLWCPKGRG